MSAESMSSDGPRGPPESLRASHSEATRERILDAAFALIERRLEPTMRAVAREAAVGERTVYRYFESHDALAEGVAPRFMGRAGVPLCATFDGIEEYVRDLFGTFERNANLVVTLLTAPWLSPHLPRTKNLAAMQRLVDDAFPSASAADRASAAASLRAALSGSGWLYLRRSCDVSNEAVIEHGIWLCRTLAARLGSGAAPRRRRSSSVRGGRRARSP